MTDPNVPGRVRQLINQLATKDRSRLIALHAILRAADENGRARLHDVAIRYREDTLSAMRLEGRDTDREAGTLGIDEARANLAGAVLPRLASIGVLSVSREHVDEDGQPIVVIEPAFWSDVRASRASIVATVWQTGEHVAVAARATPIDSRFRGRQRARGEGLVKVYRRRRVVNDVALRLQQGEIVGLLGPNGAGKTTTFYMIVGLIQPLAGRILLDGTDITKMPMYRRARRGDRVPFAGAIDLPQAVGRGQHPGDPRDVAGCHATSGRRDWKHCWTRLSIKHLRNSKAYRLVRRRAPAARDHPRAGARPEVHDAG